MAVIRPFCALRPTPDNASSVAAVPYDVVSTDEARKMATGNPLSFLRVSRAEIDLPDEIAKGDWSWGITVREFIGFKVDY